MKQSDINLQIPSNRKLISKKYIDLSLTPEISVNAQWMFKAEKEKPKSTFIKKRFHNGNNYDEGRKTENGERINYLVEDKPKFKISGINTTKNSLNSERFYPGTGENFKNRDTVSLNNYKNILKIKYIIL